MTYWPAADEWLKESPPALGLAATGIESAIEYHCAHESRWSRDFLTASGRYIGVADEPESPDDVLGPVRPRGGPNGLILRGGAIVEEWGDTERADMSFSIAKSYLAALAGIAVGQGLIGSLDDPVRKAAPHPDLVSAQNHAITWRQLLTQTSEWQGTLWSKPDSIDHNRDLGKSELGASRKGTPRAMRPPGTLWEYNDVRVNRLSLSLLQLFRRPLPDVLRETVMDPIGASSTWEWQAYRNAWAEIDGRRLPSVPGGSHWGGGLWMSTRDHARFGLLHARNGRWGAQQILPAGWVDECRQPCAINPEYGLLWWLNTGRVQFPSAPESCFAARGAGSNIIWIDRDHDLVAVVRWIDKTSLDGFFARLLSAVER